MFVSFLPGDISFPPLVLKQLDADAKEEPIKVPYVLSMLVSVLTTFQK